MLMILKLTNDILLITSATIISTQIIMYVYSIVAVENAEILQRICQ
jgi:hypothetical protein